MVISRASAARLQLFFFVLALLAATASQANAGLVIEGTRVIYQEADRETGITVSNPGAQVVLMQSWVTNDKNEESLDIPFAVLDPLTRIEPQGRHRIRILYSGAGLPPDRESLFFLNIMEVPRRPRQNNSLQFAVRQRLKLFFRPQGVKGGTSDAVASLQWKMLEGQISVTNPSRLHASLTDLALQARGEKTPLLDYLLLKPGERQYIDIEMPSGAHDAHLGFTEINDVGLQIPHTVELN